MGYKLEKDCPMINHMLFMDSLVQTIRQCSTDFGMGFGISKRAVVTWKRGRRVESRGIKLPDGEEMTEPDREGYEYLGVLEIDTIMCSEMKVKSKMST